MNKKIKFVLCLCVTIVLSMLVISYKCERLNGGVVDNTTEIKQVESLALKKLEPPKEIVFDVTEELDKIIEENKIEETEDKPKLISLGKFKLTSYCACKICCGKWAGSPTASGVMPTENHTIAVDTSVIPFGTKVVINGITYTAEDTGSAIKGNIIDIYMDDHQEALIFGVQYAEVFKVVE